MQKQGTAVVRLDSVLLRVKMEHVCAVILEKLTVMAIVVLQVNLG